MNENLEIQAREAKSSVDSLVKSLNNVNKTLSSINKEISNLDKKTNSSIKNTNNSLEKLKDGLNIVSNVKEANNAISKVALSMVNLTEYTKVYTSLANGNLLKGIQGGTNAWLKNIGVLSKANLAIGTITLAWSSFIKQYNENNKFKDSVNSIVSSIQPLVDYCKKVIESITAIVDAIVNNFVAEIATTLKVAKDLVSLDFKSLLSDLTANGENFRNNMKNVGIAIINALPFVHIETEAEKMAKKLKEVENSLFNNDGISIEKYKESIDEMLSSIVENSPSIESYNQIIEDSKTKYQEAGESLQILLTQMGTSTYLEAADDIEKFKNSLDTMTSSVKTNSQAFTDATTVIVNGLLEEGRISEETAMKVIESAQLKAKAENDNMEQYRLEIEKLNDERKKGIITAEEFRQKQIELSKEFFSTEDVVAKAKNSVEGYVDFINDEHLINMRDWQELNTNIKEIGNSYTENKKLLDSNVDSQKKIFEELQLYYKKEIELQDEKLLKIKEKYGEESKEYIQAQSVLDDYLAKQTEISNGLTALYKKQGDDSKELKQVTIESILGIISQMKSCGVDMEKEGKETVDYLNDVLKSLGLKEEVDLSQNMNSIISDINNSLSLNIPQIVNTTNESLKNIGLSVAPYVKVYADTSNAKRSIEKFGEYVNKNKYIASFGGSILGFGLKANGGIYSNGSWHNLPQYASGGIPTHGSIFVAGERGTEIVGHINGRTEVLNQSQIASAIYSAMISAMSQFNGGIAEINVHADKSVIVETAVNGINRYVKQTGELPFAIPVN